MGQVTETKHCANEYCERTLSARSKYKLCQRCRSYDKRAATKNPYWVRSRHSTLCRWDVLLIAAAPKDTFKGLQPLSAVTVAAKPLRDIVTPIRGRIPKPTPLRPRDTGTPAVPKRA